MRLGACWALLMTARITSWDLPRRRASSSLYSSISTLRWATPVSMAALATADASQISTRGSNGLGIMQSRPKPSFSNP